MAFDNEYRVLHKLTPQGEEHYRKMLEEVADEILFKHEHPFKWIAQKIKQAFDKE